MTPARRTVGIVGLLAVLAMWIVWVAGVSDFNEQAIVLSGALWFAVALAATWRTAHNLVRAMLLGVGVAAMVFVGFGARAAAARLQIENQTEAIIVLREGARAIDRLSAVDASLPDADWETVAKVVNEKGLWPMLPVAHNKGKRIERYPSMPRKDPWGCKYAFEKTGERDFVVRSSGADRRWGTPDDLIVRPDRD